VTSQGSPYMRFRRALDRGNVTEALSSASELEHVGLDEALELCLLLRESSLLGIHEPRCAGTRGFAARST
jgi:hypothetical protein